VTGERIFVAGYFGFGNLGDEAILSAMLAELRGLRPSLRATVTSGKPSETAKSHGVEAVPWRDPVAIEQAVRLADLVLIGGGGLFQDYWGFNPDTMLSESHAGLSFYAAPAVLAALHRKPLMLYAVGIGPLPSEVSRRFTKAVSETASAITVRDPASKRHLESLGVPGSKIVLSADPAFTLTPADESRTHDLIASLGLTGAPSPRVAVALRHWDIGVAPEFWERETALGLDMFLSREGGSVLFVPFQRLEGQLENDVAVAERVRSQMKHRDSTFLLDKDSSPLEIAGLLSQFDLVLGMRLHAGILAVVGGVPLVALSYDPKVTQLMEQIGFPDFAIDLGEVRAPRLADTMRRALAQRDTYAQTLRGARERMRELAQENARLAVELLKPQTAEDSDLTAELPSLVARAIRSQVRTIQDLQIDRSELLKIHSSRFWRFASVYWAVSRWVKHLFRVPGSRLPPTTAPNVAQGKSGRQDTT
jgi:polysaccharide pyruvyl transferase CsaB